MSEVVQTIKLDVSDAVSGLSRMTELTDRFNSSLSEMNKAQRSLFKEPEKAMHDFNKELSYVPKNYQKVQTSAAGINNEHKRLKPVLDQLIKSQKDFTSPADYDKLQREIAETKSRIKELGGSYDKAGREQKEMTSKGGGMFKELGSSIAGAFAVGAVLNWAQQAGAAILNVTAEFQKFDAVLTNSLGSDSAAERALNMIQDFAEDTPYSVQQLTDGFVKLAGRGIRPTVEQLTNIGDVAAAATKPLEQVIEALLDVNNTERWTELGIKVTTAGSRITGTFRGMTVEAEKTEAGALKMIEAFGQMESVSGTMGDVAKTIGGGLSNASDSLDRFFLTIGTQNTSVMGAFIGSLGTALDFLIDISSTTDQLAAKMAAPDVTKYAEQIEKDLTRVAASAKDSGKEIRTAMEEQTAAMSRELEEQRKIAQKGVVPYEKGWVNIGNRDEAAEAKKELAIVEGKIAAMADAKRFIMEDAAKKESKTEAQLAAAAEKQAEENDKKKEAARLKALSNLYKGLADLENQAAQARLNMLDKNSEAYLKAVLDADLKAVAGLEASIRENQKAAGLSTELTAEQQEQLRILTLEAEKKYFDALYKLQEQQQDTLLELQQDSDGKELEQLTRKYDQRIRAAREAGQEEVAVALETAAKLELAGLARRQAMDRLNTQESISVEIINAELPEGIDNSVDIERARQQAILDVQIEYAKKHLALLENDMTDEGILQKLQLKNTIAALESQNAALNKESKKFSLAKLLGMSDDELKAVQESSEIALGQLSNFNAEVLQMREKQVQALTNEIEEKGRQLDREIELNKQGFASNVETKREEYEELKQQREKALKDQQQAQRAQILLDGALQASNLITAGAEIFKVTAPLNVVPGVGTAVAIGLISLMAGAFIAAKAKAYQATSVPTYAKGGEGKLIKGPSHSQGGIDVVENRTGHRILNMEGGENFYVTNKKSTDKYWHYLQAINEDNMDKFRAYAWDDLFTGTGVVPNPELPQRLQTLQASAKAAPLLAGVNNQIAKEMSRYLQKISDHTKPGPPVPQITETETMTIIRTGHHTRYIRKNT